MPRLGSSGERSYQGSNHHKHEDKQQPLRLSDLPAEYVSIDPGKTHCGVARWVVERTSTPEAALAGGHVTTVRLTECYERTPDALYIELRELKDDGIGLVICESFGLQKGRNAQGSPLETVEVIGVIKYLCRMAGLRYQMQTPSIKPYPDAWLAAQVPPSRGGGHDINLLASNTHKRDAIRHGLYPALRVDTDRRAVRLVLTEHSRKRG